MKKLNLLALAIVFSIIQSNAYPVMEYSNRCGIGCGSVWWKAELYQDPDDMSWFTGAKVKCSGSGFHSCPRRNVGPDLVAIETVELETWESTPLDDVINHAWDEMDAGNAVGNYSVNYTNVTTGVIYKYTIDWNTSYFADGSVDEISYIVDRTELPAGAN